MGRTVSFGGGENVDQTKRRALQQARRLCVPLKNHFVATQQEVSIAQLWTTLSVLALPAPTAVILVEHAGHMCAATVFKDSERIPFADGSATFV
jgi:hypothetical protein